MTPILTPLRRGALTALTLLAVTLAACGGTSETSTPRGTATVTDGVVEITADELAFDVGTINAPAGEFIVHLVNVESQPHNFSVYTEEGGEPIVEGEIITGPDATVDIQVPALDAGTYFFVCDVHSSVEAMTGTLVVG
ncbi:MAG: cupredoxin domain-containing protein [Candidatus Limnocylindria bacterium]